MTPEVATPPEPSPGDAPSAATDAARPSPTSPAEPFDDARDARRAHRVLAVIVIAYCAFLAFAVPRLTNSLHSDREFTGWVGPIAERVARGERPYVDFVLPIPPGSFWLLSIVQRVAGRATLLQELWVAALSHLGMGLIAYAIAAKLSSRRVALLVSLATLVVVSQTPKECVYDHTSLILAWLSLLAGTHAALATGTRRRRLFRTTGLLAVATLAFKQSTAVGIVAGWLLAFAYLAGVERHRGRPDGVRGRLADARAFGAGALAGAGVVLGVLLAVRASIPGFFQAVLRDGPALKGGTAALLENLFTFTVRNDAVRNSVVPAVVAASIALAIVRRRGTLHVGDEGEPRASVSPGAGIAIALVALATYGTATALLASHTRGLHHVFSAVMDMLRNVPTYGFAYGAVFFAAHVLERGATTPERRERGHVLNALLLASVTCSMIYDTSFVLFFPFYYNEPSIPFALLALFVATERSGTRWATPLVLVLCMLPTFGVQLNRALAARTAIVGGHWDGLLIGYRGTEVLKAALRAAELAGPDGTVLVLPEDVQLAGLVGRRRPPLRGAIVFVDQYPERLLEDDLRTLEENLPDVIIVHPRRAREWKTMFSTWSRGSGAERFIDHVLARVLPRHYELDSTYPTIYFWDQGELGVYSRRPAEAAP